MVNAINPGAMMSAPATQQASLSDEQLATIAETLAELDADSLTEQDAISIVESFTEAGIEPGQALQSVLAELGFDAKAIGDLAASQEQQNSTPPPPPPRQSSEQISDMVSFLEQLLEEKLAENSGNELSEEDKQAIYDKVMQQFAIKEGESLINTTV